MSVNLSGRYCPRAVPPLQESDVPGFWDKVKRGVATECWNWQVRAPWHYGVYYRNGWACAAHRVAYALTYGEVPRGLVVMHTCDNPPCVNPAHLRLGTHSDNMQNAAAKNRLGIRCLVCRICKKWVKVGKLQGTACWSCTYNEMKQQRKGAA